MLLPNIRVPQGRICSATFMGFFFASDSTQWQSQLTSRQCSCRLASNHKTRTIFVLCGHRVAMKRSSNTIDLFLEPHAHLLVRFLFCRSVQMTTNKNIQRPTHQSCSSTTWMISCRPTLLKRRPAEVQMRSKLFCTQKDST